MVLSGCSHILLFLETKSLAVVPAACLFILGFLALAYMRHRVRPRFALAEKRADADLYIAGGFNPESRRNVRNVEHTARTIYEDNQMCLDNPLVPQPFEC
jgi:hypothetical protein